jgi:hypothetical protein
MLHRSIRCGKLVRFLKQIDSLFVQVTKTPPDRLSED